MHTRARVLVVAIATIALSGCTKATSPTRVATAADFAATWSGYIPFTLVYPAKTDTGTLRMTINFASSGDSLTGTSTFYIEAPRSFLTLTFANGVARFTIPLEAVEVGNPACANYDLRGVALLDQSRQNMTVTLTGTVCGSGGQGTIAGTGI